MELWYVLRLILVTPFILITACFFALIGIANVLVSGQSQQVKLTIEGWKP